jgi:iron complex transport system permease protein
LKKQSTKKTNAITLVIFYSILFIVLISAIIIGVSIGSVGIPIKEVLYIFWNKLTGSAVPIEITENNKNIILSIRLPRVVLAGLVGASLAITGAAFQGLLRNPLADPYTLGISSGASVGAVMTIFFNISLPFIGTFTLPLLSIVCAFLTMMIVLFFARLLDRSLRVETIILTGIIFSSFLGALISLMIALTGEELRQIIGWLLGSVSMRGWNYVMIILPFFIVGSLLLMINANELNVMSFGEEHAQHIGVSVQQKKMMIMVAGSILTGAAVAVSGTIGFVGLVIPHFIRLLIGPNHVHLLPASILVGSSFLIIADLFSRTVISPAELPIGVITALIGAPVFALILLRQNVKGRS